MLKYILALLVSMGGCVEAYTESHEYINSMRDGNHLYIEQSLNGEYGQYDNGDDKAFWKGYGLGTAIGLETFKFIQFQVGHTLVNLKNKDALETLQGSRVYGGGRLSFLSPIGNLELGAGVQGSHLDYQKDLDTGSFYGSGVYWSLGVDYFMSQHISIYYEAKQTREHLVRGSGVGRQGMDANSMLMGLGFRVWL